MRRFAGSIFLTLSLLFVSCARDEGGSSTSGDTAAPTDAAGLGREQGGGSSLNNAPVPPPNAKDPEPRTIRDFFMLLPEEYFVLEGCDRATDKGCRRAKIDYLKTFTEVEDTANGYLKANCDGAQSCLEMTIFKRPDGRYLIAVSTESEMILQQHFLDHADGKWTDVAGSVIPEFGKDKIYELPRRGTTMKVFAKKVIEKGDDYEIAERGVKLYDLVWRDGKFAISK